MRWASTLQLGMVLAAAAWISDGCFKDPTGGQCIGIAACQCYEDGGCNGSLVCDDESICRRSDCRPGQEECECLDGSCLSGLVCDGATCRQPGAVDGPADGDAGPADDGIPADAGPDDGMPDDDGGPDDGGPDDGVDVGDVDDGMPDDGPGVTDGPSTDDGMDDGVEPTGGYVCEEVDWPQTACGWTGTLYDCNFGGICGGDAFPIRDCPDGFTEGGSCDAFGIPRVEGCCTANGASVLWCPGKGAAEQPAVAIACPGEPEPATSGG